MAKKKTPEKPADTRSIIVTLKGNPAFREWLNRLADHNRVSATTATEHALVAYAEKTGFKEPPPSRMEP